MKSLLTPFKVGLLTVFSVAALVFGLSQVTKGGLTEEDSYQVFAIFTDATGLAPKSRVQIAGIVVGQIDTIELIGAKAKVVLRVGNEIALYDDARVSKKSEGFIGDMNLVIYPGTETEPRIPPGGEIKNVVSVGDMEKVFETLGTITADIQEVTDSLKIVAEKSGEGIPKLIDDLGKFTESVNRAMEASTLQLKAILEDIQGVTARINKLAGDETKTVTNILHNVEVVTNDIQGVVKSVDEVLGTVKDVLGTSEGSLKEGVASLRTSLNKLNQSLDSITEVTGNLAEGQGTVGRLLTDDTLITKVESAVDDVGDIVDRVAKLQTEVSLRSEFHMNRASVRNQLQLRLIPKEDKWYEIALVDPASNPILSELETVEVGGVPTTTTTRTSRDILVPNVLLAHRWRFKHWSMTGKFGLIENHGALAGDLGFAGDRLTLSLEAFDFASDIKRFPRLRLFGTWYFSEHVYVTSGVDDMLNGQWTTDIGSLGPAAPRDYFFGAGFYFTDEDLKAILATTGVPGG